MSCGFKIFISFVLFPVCHLLSSHPLLLLISYDGFRYDFINETTTPNLWKLANQGVRFKYGIRPQYYTVTSPNHYSIATGLYEESHGIVGNEFYDPVIGDFFSSWDDSNKTRFERSKDGRWYAGTTPIWLTNQRATDKQSTNRRFSGSMYWPSSDVNISGEFPSEYRGWKEIHNLTRWERDFDTLLSWFTRPTDPINFGLLYIEQPDEVLHHYGFSPESYRNITDLDKLTGYIISRLNESNLLDKMNIIFTADHGHIQNVAASVSQTYSIVDLIDNPDDVIFSNHCLFPKSDKTDMDAIYKMLSDATFSGHLPAIVVKKENFSDSFHWKNTPRVGPIIIMRQIDKNPKRRVGFNVHWNNSNPEFATSDHGYSPDEIEMRPYLVLSGPDFARNLVFEEQNVENIDLYPLMCHLLGIDPLPNNGSLSRISPVLLKKPQTLDLSNFLQSYDQKLVIVTVFGIFVPGICLLCYMLTCVMNAKPKGTVSAGYVRLTNQQAQNGAQGLVGDLDSDSEEDQM